MDANVFIASLLTEPFTDQARSLISEIAHQQRTIHAPTLLHFELVSVLRKAVYSGRVSQSQGRLLRGQLLRIPVNLHYSLDLLERAYDLAEELKRPRAYDTQYLARAERLDCEFWTCDERLFNSARASFPAVRWLGEMKD
jgi:predicted nucleic acid-binding protein